MHFDRDTIDAALTAQQILDHYGWDVRRGGGRNVQSNRCPHRAHSNPRAFVMHLETGLWVCKPCTAGEGKKVGGDKFDFIAAMEHLDARDDFPKILEMSAPIAGVSGADITSEERARLQRERDAARRERERRHTEEVAARRAKSVPIATERWNTLARNHARGEAYLAERGVLDVLKGDLVRFNEHGDICQPLYTSDGRITNIITRRLPEHAPTKDDRFRPLEGCWAKGSFVHSLSDVLRTSAPLVVLPEGFFDSLSAVLAWPDAVVLGAHGADELAELAKYVATATGRAKKTLALVPHRDKGGFTPMLAAASHANHASLTLASGTLKIIKPHAADLNDAWRAGWRPTR